MEQTAPPGPDANETLRLELYKSLRGEVTLYVEKVPGLWLQKFVLVGGMIAFLIGRHEDIAAAEAGSLLMGAAILAIPVLAALLDAKILEYVLHARAVSRFIARHYESPRVLSDWEA
ncbi:MAG TPA: hypothetical protein VFR81_02855, partial [Longimicrobium sp.]|nr:hypothetical protein [Longimicrobium sp.]